VAEAEQDNPSEEEPEAVAEAEAEQDNLTEEEHEAVAVAGEDNLTEEEPEAEDSWVQQEAFQEQNNLLSEDS